MLKFNYETDFFITKRFTFKTINQMMILQSFLDLTMDYQKQNYSQQQISHKSLWLQYFSVDSSKIQYPALDITTLQIPDFYRKNIKLSAQKMTVTDFQHPTSQKSLLKQNIITYFPPTKQFTENKIKITMQNLMVTQGALAGIKVALTSLLCTGDEIIFIQPIYSPHLTRLSQRTDIKLKTCRLKYDEKQNIFKMDFDSLKKVINQKSKILLICNPGNPATNVWSKDQLQSLTKIIKNYPNLIIVQDSSYFLYHENGNPHIPFGSLSQQNFDRSLTVYSAGTMMGVTGIKLGLIYGSRKVLKLIQLNQLNEIAVPSSLDHFVMIQNLKDAFNSNYYQNSRQKILKIYSLISQKLENMDINIVRWQGTYYLILNVQNLRNKIEKKWYKRLDNENETDKCLDKAVCRMFLKDYNIGMVPLSQCYFENPPDNFVKIAFNRKQGDIEFLLNAFKDFRTKVKQMKDN